MKNKTELNEEHNLACSSDFLDILKEISHSSEYYLENSSETEDKAFLLGILYITSKLCSVYKHIPTKVVLDINEAKALYEQYKKETANESAETKNDNQEYVQVSIDDLIRWLKNANKSTNCGQASRSKQKKG